ncbi:aminotransferase class V-fold PLP-dependent enzyme [Rhodococcus sp. NPDC058521]|uniref:aminotransferase class V-fold PLP-dependent enzyme n=1 Tax=Rhodococcus sp. NPDC058521 TaxID=3346536 RepID=UPI00364B4456
MFDLARARRETPSCTDKVFLDSAGSSLPSTGVLETVIAHLRREAEVGGYVAHDERAADLAAVKESIGTLVRCGASNIALSDSATRSWNDFFQAVPLHEGDRILISEVEYASNAIATLQRAGRVGAEVDVIPSDPYGQIDLSALETMLDERVRLVSLVHVPTNGGLVNPVREAADMAHRVGALVLLDACQSVGQIDIDMPALGVDALSATGRKWLRGPRGTGFLALRPGPDEVVQPRALDLHGGEWVAPTEFEMAADASRFEFWECDVAARLGLGAAVEHLLELGTDTVQREISERAGYLRGELSSVRGVTVRDLGEQQCGIVTFTVDGRDSRDVRKALAERNVTVTASGRSSTLLDMTGRDLESVVRASPHYFVSYEDLDTAITHIRSL